MSKNKIFLTIFLASLIIFLINFSIFCDDSLQKKIDLLIKNDPELAKKMIEKLYVLEHSKPKISYPDLLIVETDSNKYILSYNSTMKIEIGNDKYNLLYDIELQPREVRVISGRKNLLYESTIFWAIISGVFGAVLGGIVVNYTIH